MSINEPYFLVCFFFDSNLPFCASLGWKKSNSDNKRLVEFGKWHELRSVRRNFDQIPLFFYHIKPHKTCAHHGENKNAFFDKCRAFKPNKKMLPNRYKLSHCCELSLSNLYNCILYIHIESKCSISSLWFKKIVWDFNT